MLIMNFFLLISSETILTILVGDVNDNSPQFLGEPYVTQLSEVSCTKTTNSYCCSFLLLHIGLLHVGLLHVGLLHVGLLHVGLLHVGLL